MQAVMPTLRVIVEGQQDRELRLFRPLTSIGSAPENDIVIPDAGLEATHAQIRRTKDGYEMTGQLRDMTVNGRRNRRHTLEDGDRVRIGDAELVFCLSPAQSPGQSQSQSQSPEMPLTRPAIEKPGDRDPLAIYQRIHEFSVKLLNDESTEELVKTILDATIELTGADKGFLILFSPQGPEVRAARKSQKRDLPISKDLLSDSIIAQVTQTQKPLVVADALSDENWSSSASVVSLKLLSVMCCPLFDRDRMTGLLYVGNNQLTNVFGSKDLELISVFAAQASLLLAQTKRIDELSRKLQELSDKEADSRMGAIVGACASMQEVYRRARKIASTDVSVLITGETGTGKELIARELHQNSRRKDGPFVVINCGAIPENLLESELFGHVKGAFTGAVHTRIGRFQAAHGGTLFLDEIGELPVALQVKLLRALQEREVTKVGDTEPEAVDTRVLAATNRILEDEIKRQNFREDLYYRLNVVNIHLPPLRERIEDLELLATFFLQRSNKSHEREVRGFSKEARAAMRAYRWPGNVRELENRVNKGVVMTDGTMILPEDLDLNASAIEPLLPLAEAKERFVYQYIQEALRRSGQNRSQAARDLGVDPRTIFRYLERDGEP